MKSIEYGKRGSSAKKAIQYGKMNTTAENLPKPIQGVEGATYVKGKPMSTAANFKKM